MKCKPNVSITHFTRPSTAMALQVINDTAPKGYEPTITSAEDGKHGKNSLHPQGDAWDIRTRDYPGFVLDDFENTRVWVDEWIVRIRRALPPGQYDIVFGDKNHRNHIHIEFDPRGK